MKSVVDEGRWLATQSATSEADLRERFATALEGDHVVLVAEDAGVIVGSTWVHPTGVDGVWSLGTWVLQGWRRRGIGRRLIDEAIAEATAAGARKIELDAFTDNVAAISLYRSAGFEVEGIRHDHYLREDGTVKSAVIMALFPAGLRPGGRREET